MYSQTLPLPAGSPGTDSILTLWHYGTPDSGKKVYIQAALHADEWPGILTLQHLHPLLEQADINGEIIIVPYANPIGLRQFLGGYSLGRFDFDYSGNFNRGYLNLAEAAAQYLDAATLKAQAPAAQIRSIRAAFARALAQWQVQLESEQLRKTLQQLCFDADIVLDLHCDAVACAHLFANIRHRQTAETLAEALGAEVLLLEDDPGGMAFDEAAASPWWRLEKILGITLPYPTFAATVELRGERDINDSQARKDAAALFRWLGHLGVIRGAAAITVQRQRGTPLEGVAQIPAPTAGLVIQHTRPGERVHTGQIVAELINISDPTAKRLPLHSPTDGIVYALGRNHIVRPGHIIVQIAGKTPIGKGGLAF